MEAATICIKILQGTLTTPKTHETLIIDQTGSRFQDKVKLQDDYTKYRQETSNKSYLIKIKNFYSTLLNKIICIIVITISLITFITYYSLLVFSFSFFCLCWSSILFFFISFRNIRSFRLSIFTSSIAKLQLYGHLKTDLSRSRAQFLHRRRYSNQILLDQYTQTLLKH